MGLSGRKTKQRIGHDPRNLSWADDAARFGQSYLSKFGWDPSQGLGADGAGRISHLKVSQKLDLFGIGAAHQKDPNGIAWKQNKDFESLLARLNGAEGSVEGGSGTKVDGFVRPGEQAEEEQAEEQGGDDGAETRKRKKVRSDEGEDRERRKKKRKDKGSSSKTKKREGTEESADAEPSASADESPAPVVEAPPPTALARGPTRGHRARFIRSKRMALTDAAAVAEVLGIAPSSSTTPSSSTPLVDTLSTYATTPVLELEKLTTSSESVMDYFKKKLLEKSGRGSGAATPCSAGGDDAADAAPGRRGIGSSKLALPPVQDDREEGPSRVGLGGFARSSAMLFAMASRTELEAAVDVECAPSSDIPVEPAGGDDDADTERARRKQEKRERRKRKEVSKLQEAAAGVEEEQDDTERPPPQRASADGSTAEDCDSEKKEKKRGKRREAGQETIKTVDADDARAKRKMEKRARKERKERAMQDA